jgi:hypothetical protein
MGIGAPQRGHGPRNIPKPHFPFVRVCTKIKMIPAASTALITQAMTSIAPSTLFHANRILGDLVSVPVLCVVALASVNYFTLASTVSWFELLARERDRGLSAVSLHHPHLDRRARDWRPACSIGVPRLAVSLMNPESPLLHVAKHRRRTWSSA